MLSTNYSEASIKYTTVIPQTYIDELKKLTEKKRISSVSQGIRLAIEDFVTIQKRLDYVNSISEAAKDDAFIKRTLDTQNDFAFVDEEGEDTW